MPRLGVGRAAQVGRPFSAREGRAGGARRSSGRARVTVLQLYNSPQCQMPRYATPPISVARVRRVRTTSIGHVAMTCAVHEGAEE